MSLSSIDHTDVMSSNDSACLCSMSNKSRLLDTVRTAIRLRHYSYRTEKQYVAWIRRFIRFHAYRHPADMGGPEVEAFLSDLAVNGKVAAATQAQALAALLFLYKQVLMVEFVRPASANRRRATHSGTAWPRTCSNRAAIFVPSRSSWATPALRPRRSVPTS